MNDDDDRGTVTISFKTAEYLAILIGHNNWGNQIRRGAAAEELGNAMGCRQMSTSMECFTQAKKEKL